MLFSKAASTRNISVFSMREEDALSKKILSSKSKREKLVRDFLNIADDKEKLIFLENLLYLHDQLIYHLDITERLYIYLDNNVLQDIFQQESNKERRARYFAVMALLCYAEDYLLVDIFAFIAPSVVYECSGRGTRDVEVTIREMVGGLAGAGLRTYFPFRTDKRNLLKIFKRIEKDQKEIAKALNIIKRKSWKRDFRALSEYPGGIAIPLSVAEHECPEIKLCYFDPWVVKHMLILRIENMMYQSSKDDNSARRMMNSPDNVYFNIVNNKGDKNKINGLGDIELLSSCDLMSQTSNYSPTIAIAITFDKNLRIALSARSRTVSSTSFVSGVDEPEDATNRVAYIYKIAQRKERKNNRRARSNIAALKLFFKAIGLK